MTTEKSTTAISKRKEITEQVLSRINTFIETGTIRMPKNYVPENALRAAFLLLQETTTRDNKPVLEACTGTSIANALLEMTLKGLNPYKKHGNFIAYGKELQWQEEYAGNKVLAKRFAGVKEITHNTVFEGDEFVYEIIDGRKQIVKHVQCFKNIDMDKIIGAYATAIFEDGSKQSEIMNIKQIRQAWQQGSMKGQSPAHKNFPDRMAEKTVSNRLCRQLTNASDDGAVFDDTERSTELVKAKETDMTKKEIEDINFEEVDAVETEKESKGVEQETTQQEDMQEEKPEKEAPEKNKEQSTDKKAGQPKMDF